MKYVDASAVLRLVFAEPGPKVPVAAGEILISSRLVEVESFRAMDRLRLLGHLDDAQTALKIKELAELLRMIDLAAVDVPVIERARSSFPVNVRTLDALHVATAEVLAAEFADDPLEFWTHDLRQAQAAMARGLTVRGLAAVPPP